MLLIQIFFFSLVTIGFTCFAGNRTIVETLVETSTGLFRGICSFGIDSDVNPDFAKSVAYLDACNR